MLLLREAILPQRGNWRPVMRSHFFGLAVLMILSALPGCQKTASPSESHPDLSGVWIGPSTNLLPPAAMTPEGQALFEATKPLYGPRSVPVAESNDPVNTCDPQGFPRILFLRSPLSGMEFIRTPDRMLQVFYYQHAVSYTHLTLPTSDLV